MHRMATIFVFASSCLSPEFKLASHGLQASGMVWRPGMDSALKSQMLSAEFLSYSGPFSGRVRSGSGIQE